MAYTTAELEASLNGFTEKINELDAGKFITNALFGGDANSLENVRFNKSFLENIKKTLEDSAKRAGAEVEKVSKEKLKQMVDPFGLSDPKTAKEMKDKVAAYKNKVNQFLDLTLPEEQKNKNDALKAVLESSSRYTAEQYELMRNAPIDQPKDPKTNKFIQRTDSQKEGLELLKDFQKNIGLGGMQEQKSFESGETTVGSFSRNAKRDLLEVLQLDKMFEKLGKDIADKDKKDKDKEGSDFGSMLTKLLGGGIAAAFMGIVGLASAFSTNGPAKGIFELFGKMGAKAGLSSLAKLIFKDISKTALKRIPIIGTLFSYGFAAQRFMSGDIIGGILDIASGTINLLDWVAPGLGTVLAIGVDTMQAVLDYKAGEGTTEEIQSKKSDILKGWGKKMVDLLIEKAPFVKNLIDFGQGMGLILEGLGITGTPDSKKIRDGSLLMSNLPIFGVFPALVADLLDAEVTNDQGEVVGFDTKKFVRTFRNHVKNTILKWIPNTFGLRDMYAKQALGMSDAEISQLDNEVDESTRNIVTATAVGTMLGNPMGGLQAGQSINNLKNINIPKFDKENYDKKIIEQKEKELEEYKNGKYSKVKENILKTIFPWKDIYKQNIEMLENEIKELKEKDKQKINKNVSSTPVIKNTDINKSQNNPELSDEHGNDSMDDSVERVQDFVTSGKVKITDSMGRSVTTAPDDITYAAKDGGLIDKKLTALFNVFSEKLSESNKSLLKLIEVNSLEKNNNNSFVNITGGQQSKGYSSANSNLEYRLHHIRMHDSGRVAC